MEFFIQSFPLFHSKRCAYISQNFSQNCVDFVGCKTFENILLKTFSHLFFRESDDYDGVWDCENGEEPSSSCTTKRSLFSHESEFLQSLRRSS